MRAIGFIILSIVLVAWGCSPGGPVTPKESFNELLDSIESRDYRSFYSSLSSETKKKIKTYISSLKSLNDRQKKSVSASYGLSVNELLALNSSEMAALIFISDRSNSSLVDLYGAKIRALKIYNKYAEIETHRGVKLSFVKEGPYWKVDLSDL